MFSKAFTGSLSAYAGLLLMFAAVPSSTNYKLESYGMGSGGTAGSTSSAYSMEAISGETSGTQMSGTSYMSGSGMIYTQLANVPAAPAFTNPSNYYNKLKLVIDNGGNPTDAKFAVAISTDNFVTTKYVQSDRTVGVSLGTEDYLTYASWGSASGVNIIGLAPHTTYKVKVRAMNGAFTESGYSEVATAATVDPSLTFDLDISASDTETNAPYAIAFADLLPGSVVDSGQKIWTDFDTNGETGGNVYMYGTYAGLRSSRLSTTISSVSGDLGAVGEGFGIQSTSAGQVSGGPFSAVNPYNGASNTVGIADTNIRRLYTTSAPIVTGRTSMLLKAKASATTPAAADYSEVLTIIAAPNF